MGLAASQARFLGITARKNACELRSMQIAQEKLSITNQLSKISQDYQNSLDATRLVWDSDYIIDGSIYDVNYDLLMHPSELNDYSPQILTNFRNQVVLDNRYANALENLQVNVGGTLVNMQDLKLGGTSRNQTNFVGFLTALNQNGILGTTKYDAILQALTDSSGTLYRPDNGLGGYVQEMFTVDSMNLATLKNYIHTITNQNSEYMNDLKEKNLTNFEEVTRIGQLLNFANFEFHITTNTEDGSTITKDYTGSFGEWATKDDSTRGKVTLTDTNFNLADLLTKEITLSSTDANAMETTLKTFIEKIYEIMKEFFPIRESSTDQDYLNFAMSQICELNNMKWDSIHNIVAQRTGTDGSTFYLDKGGILNSGSPARDHTSVIQNDGTFSVSLSNVVKGIMTFFEKAIEGFTPGYHIESTETKKVSNSFYITDNPSHIYFIDNPESIDNLDQETQCLIEFYSQLFNQICANGWTRNDAVSDQESLKNMLKNGTVFTSVLSDDGMFYQGPYTSNNYIAEVADEDAITRAELEFKTQQAKLNAKEEQLNIDMQLVDAELSALTTEYDTVKGLISKAVEKGFSTLGGG